MADAALDSGRNGGKQAEGEAPAAAAAATGGIKAWLPLIITVLLMPALAFATTKFVLVPQMKKSLGAAAAPATPETPGAATGEGKEGAPGEGVKSKIKIPLNKILVNVAGTMGTRYLMTSITVVGNSEELRAKVEENKDQLMDLATSALSTKTISDLEKPGARNLIRSELITVFNNAMGGPWISEIYITEMAIQ